jgi:hypothetical protein
MPMLEDNFAKGRAGFSENVWKYLTMVVAAM